MPVRTAGHPPNNRRRTRAVVAASVAAALPLIVWWALPPQSPPPLPPAPLAAAPLPLPARAPAHTAKLPAAKTADAAAPRLEPGLEAQVRALTITARRTGDGARIVIDGQVFEPGEAVLAGVFLEAVLPDRVVFRTAHDQRVELRL